MVHCPACRSRRVVVSLGASPHVTCSDCQMRSRIASGQRVRLGGIASFDVGLEVVRRLVAQHGATVLEYDVRGDEISVDLRLPVRPDVQRFHRQVDRYQGTAESCRQLQLTFQSLRMRLRAERIEQRALLARLGRSLGRLADGLVTCDDVSRYQQLQQDLEHSDQELETTTERLQSTNEELEATNEELQATNEELQATNEELQATNEELQATNEELYALNEEFRERSTELDRLKASLEGIMSRVRVGVVVLDPNREGHVRGVIVLMDQDVEKAS